MSRAMNNRKKLATAIVVVAILIASIIIVRFPSTVGSIVVPDDYSSIQTAVDNAFSGQTVYVKSGIYTGQSIAINKPLSLIGENPNNTILVGINNFRYSPPYVIQISADNVKVAGFTIMNGSLGGIRVEKVSSDIQPFGCIISGNNIVNNNNDGVCTYGGKALTISNNNISNNTAYGIYDSSSQSVISNNYIAENGVFGIIVDSSSGVSVNHNIIERNGNVQNNGEQGGIVLRWFGNFDVYANNITDNIGDGLQFSEGCSNSIVHDNNIENNTIGIDLFNFAITNNSENIGIGLDDKVYRNNLSNYQNAFIQTAFAYGNISTITYAIGNGTDVVSWDNGMIGNYWSDHKGNGSYVIDENNVDHYPLILKVDISVPIPSQINVVSILPIAVTLVLFFVVIISLLLYRQRRKTISQNKPKV